MESGLDSESKDRVMAVTLCRKVLSLESVSVCVCVCVHLKRDILNPVGF